MDIQNVHFDIEEEEVIDKAGKATKRFFLIVEHNKMCMGYPCSEKNKSVIRIVSQIKIRTPDHVSQSLRKTLKEMLIQLQDEIDALSEWEKDK